MISLSSILLLQFLTLVKADVRLVGFKGFAVFVVDTPFTRLADVVYAAARLAAVVETKHAAVIVHQRPHPGQQSVHVHPLRVGPVKVLVLEQVQHRTELSFDHSRIKRATF